MMQTQSAHHGIAVQDFDKVWGKIAQPDLIEQAFLEFLPQAEQLEDKSTYLQLLSQLGLAQALLKKFDLAHATLDKAKNQLQPEHDLAHVRILLERGRVFQQEGDLAKARVYYERSFDASVASKIDDQTINAAHMIALVAEKVEDRIKWNQHAIDLAMASHDPKAHRWLGSVWNNLGTNYFETKQFDKALFAFEKTLEFRKQEQYAPNIRFAQFRVAQLLRIVGHVEKALQMQQQLLVAYNKMEAEKSIDMPMDMFILTRGWIYEEFIEIYHVAIKVYAHLAYKDLSLNEMFARSEPARLDRLKKLKDLV